MDIKIALKKAKRRLCAKCQFYPKRWRYTPAGVDEKGRIIYVQVHQKCHLTPLTTDGEDCPYYRQKET